MTDTTSTLGNVSQGGTAHPDLWTESSGNSSSQPAGHQAYHIPLAEKIVEGGLLSLVCVVALIGNTCLWFVVLGNRSLRNAANWLILCLSAADLLVSFVNMPLTIVSIFTGRWIFNDITCVGTGFTNMVTFIASVMSLGTISINRYVKVCRSSSYASIYTPRNVGLMAAGVWLLSISLATPPLIGWGVYDYLPNQSFCFCDWTSSVSYTFFMVGTCFGGPCTAMTVSYVLILRTYRRSKQKVRPGLSKKPRELRPLSTLAAGGENSGRNAGNTRISALSRVGGAKNPGKLETTQLRNSLRRVRLSSLPCSCGVSGEGPQLNNQMRRSLRTIESDGASHPPEESGNLVPSKPIVVIDQNLRSSCLCGRGTKTELHTKSSNTDRSQLPPSVQRDRHQNLLGSEGQDTEIFVEGQLTPSYVSHPEISPSLNVLNQNDPNQSGRAGIKFSGARRSSLGDILGVNAPVSLRAMHRRGSEARRLQDDGREMLCSEVHCRNEDDGTMPSNNNHGGRRKSLPILGKTITLSDRNAGLPLPHASTSAAGKELLQEPSEQAVGSERTRKGQKTEETPRTTLGGQTHRAVTSHGQPLSHLSDSSTSTGRPRTATNQTRLRVGDLPCPGSVLPAVEAPADVDPRPNSYSTSPSDVRKTLLVQELPAAAAAASANRPPPAAASAVAAVAAVPAKVDCVESDFESTLTSVERSRRSEDRRLTLTLLVIILVFVVAWFPFCVTMFLSVFLEAPLPRPPDFFSLFLGYANSACNPIIYGFGNAQYRQGYKRLFLKVISPFRACARGDSVTSQTSSSYH